MGRRIFFDIETTGLLNSESVDYSSMPYKIKDTYQTHCICVEDIDTLEKFSFINNGVIDETYKFIDFLMGCDVIGGQNIVNFDLLSLKLSHGLEYEIGPNIHKRLKMSDKLEEYPDTLFGRPVRFVDTLVLSKLFNADRPGGHSLKAWGKRLNDHKGSYGKETPDAWAKYSPEMEEYCVQDTSLTKHVYMTELLEIGLTLTESNLLAEWEEAYQIELAVVDLVTRSSHFGFAFNIEFAKKCVIDLNNRLKMIEDEVHPQLPPRSLPNGKQPKFPKNAWKIPFKYDAMFTKAGKLKKCVTDYLSIIGIDTDKHSNYIASMLDIEDGAIIGNHIEDRMPKDVSLLTSSSISYCERFGITGLDDCATEIRRVEAGGTPKVLTEPMTLANKDDVKKHIINLGWKPTVFNETDMLLDAKKKKRATDDVVRAINKYVNETIGSAYEVFRCEHLKCNGSTLRSTLENLCGSKNRVIVRSTPKYTVDKEKNICPNLLKIKDKVPFINKVVSHLIYSHRRNSILSPNGTGWLANKRLSVDGHIPTPADTLGAVTGRFTHKDVCNIARVTTLYGKEMRGLFGVDKNHFLLTADGDSLENKIEAHFCYKYPGGPEYAALLAATKPNDFHTVMAKKLGIERNDEKSLKYGLSYGQQVNGLAKSMGWTIKKAKQTFDDFWVQAAPLKLLKEKIEAHWESNNRKFIVGIDGRKYPARASHLLTNLLFQGSGVLCMKRQHIFLDRMLKDENLLGDPFVNDLSKLPKSILIIAYHDEESQAIHKDLVRLKSFDTKEEAVVCKKELENKGFIMSDINHGIPEICGGKYFLAWSKVIELTSKSMNMAGDYYSLNVALTQSGQIGMNWSQTH